MATANTTTERTSCCDAQATYMDFELICKKCYNSVEWVA